MTRAALALAALALAACADPVAPPVPAKLEVLRGPTAISVPGQRYDTISVRLTGTGGESIVGWPVTWSGDGQVVPLDSVTDDVGIARVEWTLPRYGTGYTYATNGPSGAFGLGVDAVGVESRTLTTTARAFTADTAMEFRGYGCGFSGGELWCWSSGWRPDGLPHRIAAPSGLVPKALAGNHRYLCVLGGDRRPRCEHRFEPKGWTPVPNAPPLLDLFANGGVFGVGICGRAAADSATWCWPDRDDIPLIATLMVAKPLAQVALGIQFGCGLDADGVPWCWGDNSHGQLGRPGASSDAPIRVNLDGSYLQVSAGGLTACAVGTDHRVWCWGDLHPLSTSGTPVLVDSRIEPVKQMAVGALGELYVLRGGRLRVFLTPVDDLLTDLWFDHLDVRSFSAGHGSFCLTAQSSEVYCSLEMIHGLISHAYIPDRPVPVPDPTSRPYRPFP